MPIKWRLRVGAFLFFFVSLTGWRGRDADIHDIEGPPCMEEPIAGAKEVSLREIIRDPARYDAEIVHIQALLHVFHENEFLCAPGAASAGDAVWVEFDPSFACNDAQMRKRLFELTRPLRTAFERIVDVNIVGRFEVAKDDGFGHLDGFRYRFSIMHVVSAEPAEAEGAG